MTHKRLIKSSFSSIVVPSSRLHVIKTSTRASTRCQLFLKPNTAGNASTGGSTQEHTMFITSRKCCFPYQHQLGLSTCSLSCAFFTLLMSHDIYREGNGRLGKHLIVCVHGMSGNMYDLRMIKLELNRLCSNLTFLMSSANQVGFRIE
jgi:hypothetical protein